MRLQAAASLIRIAMIHMESLLDLGVLRITAAKSVVQQERRAVLQVRTCEKHSRLQNSQREKQALMHVFIGILQRRSQGRMCEVVPPASRRSYFTFLIRTFGAQRTSCSARQVGRAGGE